MSRKRNAGATGCDEIVDKLTLWLDGELDPREHAAVAEHLEECRDCRELSREFERLDTVVMANARQITAGHGFVASVMKEVRQTSIEGLEQPASKGFFSSFFSLFAGSPARRLAWSLTAVLLLTGGAWFTMYRLPEGGARLVTVTDGAQREFARGLTCRLDIGSARIQPAGKTAWQSLSGSVAVKAGDRIMTARSSMCTLVNRAGTAVTVLGASGLQVQSDAVGLVKGRAFFDVASHTETFSVTVPNGTVMVHGTVFTVAIKKDESATVILWEGKISLQHTGGANLAMAPYQKAVVSQRGLSAVPHTVSKSDRRQWQDLLVKSDRVRDGRTPALSGYGDPVHGSGSIAQTVEVEEFGQTGSAEPEESAGDSTQRRPVRGRELDSGVMSGEGATIDEVFDASF